MDNFLTLATHIPRAVWVVIGVPAGLGLLSVAARGSGRTVDGWQVLRPSLALYLLGIVAIPMAALMFMGPFLAFSTTNDQSVSGSAFAILMFEPVMGLAFLYSAASIFLVRIRFNDNGVEKKWFVRGAFLPWGYIRTLDRSVFKGPRLVLANGRSVAVSKYLRGFSQLATAARDHGVSVAAEFTYSQPST
jgi:hypothetical protein